MTADWLTPDQRSILAYAKRPRAALGFRPRRGERGLDFAYLVAYGYLRRIRARGVFRLTSKGWKVDVSDADAGRVALTTRQAGPTEAWRRLGLTEARFRILAFAAERPVNEPEICPRRGQHQAFEHLVARGYLRRSGHGVDRDNHERNVRLYQITAKGRKTLR